MRSGTLAIDAESSHAFDNTSAATVVGTGMPIFDTWASKKRVAHDCDLTSTLSKACVCDASSVVEPLTLAVNAQPDFSPRLTDPSVNTMASSGPLISLIMASISALAAPGAHLTFYPTNIIGIIHHSYDDDPEFLCMINIYGKFH